MDALTLLAQDHKTVERLFKRFEASEGKPASARRKLVDRMIVELSRHAAVEEALLYPSVRQTVPDAEHAVLESLEEHHVVKWLLNELKDLPPRAERFDAKVSVLMENVRHHVEEEENELFPRLRKALGQSKLRALGEQMERARKVAPTRPHPRSPDSPPANLFSTPVAAALDRGLGLVKAVSPWAAGRRLRKAIGGFAARRRDAASAERASPSGSA